MMTKVSYIVEMNAIDPEELTEATDAIVDSLSCSIAYKPHDNGEWWEVVVTCDDDDLLFVELMLTPFV